MSKSDPEPANALYKKRIHVDADIREEKTQISCAVTTQLISAFAFGTYMYMWIVKNTATFHKS